MQTNELNYYILINNLLCSDKIISLKKAELESKALQNT